MKLIVGLGNPGLEYERTRHNAGFLALDRLAARHARGAIPRARFQAVTIDATMPGLDGDEKVMLLKPMTYMNLSGAAVADALRFFKLGVGEDLFVLVDDVALPCGAIRIRAEGSAGGHNGLADLERRLGTQAYPRCRIGVDAPGVVPQADYVTGRFSAAQWTTVQEALDRAADAAEHWVAHGVQSTMNRFNVRPASKDAAPDSKDSDRND